MKQFRFNKYLSIMGENQKNTNEKSMANKPAPSNNRPDVKQPQGTGTVDKPRTPNEKTPNIGDQHRDSANQHSDNKDANRKAIELPQGADKNGNPATHGVPAQNHEKQGTNNEAGFPKGTSNDATRNTPLATSEDKRTAEERKAAAAKH